MQNLHINQNEGKCLHLLSLFAKPDNTRRLRIFSKLGAILGFTYAVYAGGWNVTLMEMISGVIGGTTLGGLWGGTVITASETCGNKNRPAR
ncbi:hypothetical protein AYO45_05765 [Gammaproteobacteria bacterium SCGC AG-212-F23]|nr:hypothetical protein AYO45_05765 [Gammaproteobacteria bacterium SCGC AG-212-F23]